VDNRGRTHTHRKWSEEELGWLEFAYPNESVRRICSFLERSRGSVVGMAYRLGLCNNIKKDEVAL